MDVETIARVRIEARHRWGYASPYRVGLIAGEWGADIANPYDDGSNSARLFSDGAARGAERRVWLQENGG